MAAVRAVGSIRVRALGGWFARHPEWWPLAISMAAWLSLVSHTQHEMMPLCAGAPPLLSPFVDAFSRWILMTVGMMPPLVVLSVRHVGFRSFRDRRHTAVAEFLAGYLGVWIAAGALLLFLLFATDILAGTERRLVAVLAYGAAIVWQLTPFKRQALWRCHRTVPLAIERWRTDLSCLRFGASTGVACLSSCWLLMALPVLTADGVLAMVCLQAAMVHERYQQRLRPRLTASVLLLCTALLLDLNGSLA
jgi:predicted metal-binding membrane protein